MAINTPSGSTFGKVVGTVFDSQGKPIQPQLPYVVVDDWDRAFRREWRSVDEMLLSLTSAPPARGLPDGAPSPNDVFEENGVLFRYVCDPDFMRTPFVNEVDGKVHERMQFRRQYVALSLQGARDATDRKQPDEPETDFWCGYSWIRGGYSIERSAAVEKQIENSSSAGHRLIFNQPADPTNAARIRHEVAHLDRTSPTLPVDVGSTPPVFQSASAPATPPPAPQAAPAIPKAAAARAPKKGAIKQQTLVVETVTDTSPVDLLAAMTGDGGGYDLPPSED